MILLLRGDVAESIADMQGNGESIPCAFRLPINTINTINTINNKHDKHCIPPEVHHALVISNQAQRARQAYRNTGPMPDFAVHRERPLQALRHMIERDEPEWDVVQRGPEVDFDQSVNW